MLEHELSFLINGEMWKIPFYNQVNYFHKDWIKLIEEFLIVT